MPRDRPLLFYNWIIIGAKFAEKVTEQRKRASGARTATFSNCLDIRGRTRSLAQLTVRARSEEHTSELQSLMRLSYAVFCLKTKTDKQTSLYRSADKTQKVWTTHDNV